jgi:acyl carrier protein
MNTEELMASLKEIVKPYVKNEEGFNNMTEETDFLKDLKINSANLIDVILDIETAFDIEIDNASMEKMITVKSALEIIETKLAAK